MTCDRPIRDRSGEELPGVTCNLWKGHLGRCVQGLIAIHPPMTWVHSMVDIPREAVDATVTPSEPSGQPEPSDPT